MTHDTPTPTSAGNASALLTGVMLRKIRRQARARRKPFALILTGTALQPRYCHNDRLTVCPAREPAAGDAVVAQLAEHHGGGIAVMVLNADADLYDYRGAFVPRGEYLTIGVVVRGYPSRVSSE